MSGPVVFFAGGGTGGHLFPSVAVLERLIDLVGPSFTPHFLCSRRPIDAEILGREHLTFSTIPARPLGLRPAVLARFILGWPSAVREARRVIRRITRETGGKAVMLTTGGFVSAPAVRAAVGEGVPVVMLNLDAVPGRANRWIAGRATRRLTSAPVRGHAGWDRIGPVVRRAALPPGSAEACRARAGLDPSSPVLLVCGASLGASSINEMMTALASAPTSLLRRGWQVLHQTGSGEAERVRRAYAEAGVRAVVEPFVAEMGVWWGSADLAVARAGAGLVAEAWASRTPTVFMPYPYHRDQHQRANALPLVEAGGARVEADAIEPGRNIRGAGAVIEELMGDGGTRSTMREALARLGSADGAGAAAGVLASFLR
ncbi:MAG: UDP-N-acetylglucosamine--N-acetylmuramyl-(pentapeptide) pyrophosphoryl-undecaprenol N-acetylglucosamine transferase [Phycisphaeraceae bacterium]|nr:MAG: UDP-N-acetylglucosamine--N-acetylmuramyl-(pentapeptide) pyrophosphoryl-undecaprenol N-acetylglucosamine transferase [Phycisphaeraceae bacterium]